MLSDARLRLYPAIRRRTNRRQSPWRASYFGTAVLAQPWAVVEDWCEVRRTVTGR